MNQEIEFQRKEVFESDPRVNLVRACKIGDGILQLTEEQKTTYQKVWQAFSGEVSFFIPASGSGSRMFQFLFDFMANEEKADTGEVERFFNHLQEFAFFHLLDDKWKKLIRDQQVDLVEFGKYLLESDGLNYGNFPKGLIPFHEHEPFVINAFQEQVLQGLKLLHGSNAFHFTVNKEWEEKVTEAVQSLENFTGHKVNFSLSNQLESTHAFAFEKNQSIATENGEPIRRPAGHGALLENLQSIDQEVVLIKNIDNVQHFSKSDLVNEWWQNLTGLLLEFKEEMKRLYKEPSVDLLKSLNERYQFLDASIVASIESKEQVLKLIHRPIRVCGMVKNEGQPGGGPFWISEDGTVSKQIVEKAQIRSAADQSAIMVKSTHFNPVMIVASFHDFEGRKFQLKEFTNTKHYFVVNKNQKGQDILYRELPGLWNGGMANWNTLFVEIPSAIFSPVKSVLDLLQPLHKK